jgi:hypothetical protein
MFDPSTTSSNLWNEHRPVDWRRVLQVAHSFSAEEALVAASTVELPAPVVHISRLIAYLQERHSLDFASARDAIQELNHLGHLQWETFSTVRLSIPQ